MSVGSNLRTWVPSQLTNFLEDPPFGVDRLREELDLDQRPVALERPGGQPEGGPVEDSLGQLELEVVGHQELDAFAAERARHLLDSAAGLVVGVVVVALVGGGVGDVVFGEGHEGRHSEVTGVVEGLPQVGVHVVLDAGRGGLAAVLHQRGPEGIAGGQVEVLFGDAVDGHVRRRDRQQGRPEDQEKTHFITALYHCTTSPKLDHHDNQGMVTFSAGRHRANRRSGESTSNLSFRDILPQRGPHHLVRRSPADHPAMGLWTSIPDYRAEMGQTPE
jgi:hypothetical protein